MRDWLIKIRENKNLLQEDMAEYIGTSRSYYCMIENGKRNPSVIIAKKIAEVLGFGWEKFFEDSD